MNPPDNEDEDDELDELLDEDEVRFQDGLPIHVIGKRRRRRGGPSGSGLQIFTTPSTLVTTTTALVGAFIATISVIGNPPGYTFSLSSNPGGLFSVVGNQLLVASSPLVFGVDPITLHADNGAGSVLDLPTFVVVQEQLDRYLSSDYFPEDFFGTDYR